MLFWWERNLKNSLKTQELQSWSFDDDPLLPSNISNNFSLSFNRERCVCDLHVSIQGSFGQKDTIVSCDHFQKLGIAKFLPISALQKK